MDGLRALRRSNAASSSHFSSLLLLGWSALLAPRALAQDAPNTLQTITTTPTSIPSPTERVPSATSTPSVSSNPSGAPELTTHGFNYYFLVISLAVVFFFLLLCYTIRRRRIKATIIRNNHARALSEDVGGFRSPRYGRGWGWPVDGDRNTPPRGIGLRGGRGRRRGEDIEGLNERGEAPPPYGVGSKPPSLRSFDGISGRCESRAESASTVDRRPSQDVEMGDMARPRHDAYEPPRTHWRPQAREDPPAYQDPPTLSGTEAQQSSTSEMATVTRPEAAVTRP